MNKIVQTFTTFSGDEGAHITNDQHQMSHYLKPFTIYSSTVPIAMFCTRAHFKAKIKMWLDIIILVYLIYYVQVKK